MCLIKKIDDFFDNYDSLQQGVEVYANDLIKLLHELAGELKAKERQSINDLSSSLETDIRQIRDLDAEVRQTKSTKDEARLKEVQRQVSRNINDFRSGDLLVSYRQRTSKSKAKSSPDVPIDENRSDYSSEASTKTDWGKTPRQSSQVEKASRVTDKEIRLRAAQKKIDQAFEMANLLQPSGSEDRDEIAEMWIKAASESKPRESARSASKKWGT